MSKQEERLSRQEAADYLGVTSRTLNNWEKDGKGPKFYRLSSQRIWYLRADLQEFLESALVEPEADQ